MQRRLSAASPAAPATGANYPIPASAQDPRFCFGLIYDVAKAMESHGFPPITGVDHVQLGQALFRFVYRTPQDLTANEPEGVSS